MTQAGIPRHNLPIEATSFVGRAFALTEVRRLLGETRLLTLTGPGGCGKTRLALRAAAGVLDSFAGGVWFADLATVSSADLLSQKIASTLGIRELRDAASLTSLSDAIGAREVLLVMDNCEHLIEACALLAELALTANPNTRLLATSREPLRANGETVWAVPPLALPAPGFRLPLNLLEQVDAVALFLDRTRARRPGFQFTADQASKVVEICRRLDGLPLAIELAAAQTAGLTVEQIAAHLDGMLGLLRGGRRTLARHETIRATIDWSHALLSDDERDLFRRLAVFRGGFQLEAAELVCSVDPAQAAAVLHALLRLVDKSLVVAETGGGATRYRLLEPVRQYAAELLPAAGELRDVQERHARYYVALAEEAERWLRGPRRKEWLDRLEADQDNLRAVFVWSRGFAPDASESSDGGGLGLRLAGALFWFWFWNGNRAEGRRWSEEVVSATGRWQQRAARAGALYTLGTLAWMLGDERDAGPRLEECAALYRELGDHPGQAYALLFLGLTGDPGVAGPTPRSLIAEAEALLRSCGDPWGMAHAAHMAGLLALRAGRYSEALVRLDDSLALFRELGDVWEVSQVLAHKGDLARSQGGDLPATAYYEESLRLYGAQGVRVGVPSVVHNLGYLALRQQQPGRALGYFQESMSLFSDQGDHRGVAECLAGSASALGALHQPDAAAHLMGAAASLFESSGTTMWPANLKDHQRGIDLIRAQLEDTAFETAVAAGRAMPLASAIALAASAQELASELRQGVRSAAGTHPEPGSDHPLTPRELEVALLVARGMTSRQIGAALFITEGTAALHVKHILGKLGFTSRAQVAAWAVKRGLAIAPAAGP